MAKDFIIERRKKGRSPTKHGILLKNLEPRYQKVLKNNPIISKYSDDDRFIKCLFLIEDAKINVSYLNKPQVNPVTREVSSFASIVKDYNFLDWKCAFCLSPIKVEIGNFKTENFTCKKCYKYYIKNSNTVSESVIQSTMDFVEYNKKLIKEDQKKFLKYIERNGK